MQRIEHFYFVDLAVSLFRNTILTIDISDLKVWPPSWWRKHATRYPCRFSNRSNLRHDRMLFYIRKRDSWKLPQKVHQHKIQKNCWSCLLCLKHIDRILSGCFGQVRRVYPRISWQTWLGKPYIQIYMPWRPVQSICFSRLQHRSRNSKTIPGVSTLHKAVNTWFISG